MATWKESEHIRDRQFEVIYVLESSVGPFIGNHPDSWGAFITNRLKDAAKNSMPVLSGSVSGRQIWADAWKDQNGEVHGTPRECIIYSGHVRENATSAQVEEFFKALAETTKTAFRSPLVLVSIDGISWVLSDHDGLL